jgi:succinate dehydrogenase / fumarate reductase iron-sulfur subunit
MDLKLKVWKQRDEASVGQLIDYDAPDISPDMSFLEMLDVINERLITKGEEPIAFDSDCREGICGSCSCMINGIPHGPQRATATCQLHMRHFKDGDEIVVEPFRATAFPVVKDLIVNRSSFDRIIQAGGYISVRTGSAVEANNNLIPKEDADLAMDAAACIGCGACVAACKNASAMLFVAAKAAHLNLLPQGKPEKDKRVLKMVAAMDEAGFGNCTNYYECSAACPKSISEDFIAMLNRDYMKASVKSRILAKPTAGR